MIRFRDLSGREYWNLVWPFALSLLSGIVLHRLAPSHAWHGIPSDLFLSLADALMVAGILGLLLELFATRLLVEKVSSELAEKLVGRGLPAEIQGHIKTIVDTDIVRDHYVKTYKLSFVDNQQLFVYVDVTLSFDVKNYSDAAVDYVPFYQEEDFFNPQFMSLEYGFVGKQRLSETERETNADTKVLTVKGKKKIKLSPIKHDAGSVCEVAMRYRLTMPAEYTDITDFGGATLGAKLRVEALPYDLEFFSHGHDSVTNLPNGDQSWHFDRSYVTGQSIRVWWFRKKPDVDRL